MPTIIDLRQQGTMTFVDGTEFTPGVLIYAQINSNPNNGNPSTEGEGFGLYRRSSDTGAVTFHVPTADLLPDLPRLVIIEMREDPNGDPLATLTRQFS